MRRVLTADRFRSSAVCARCCAADGLTEEQTSSRARDAELVKLFELKPGMTVADIGAGFARGPCGSRRSSVRRAAYTRPTSARRSFAALRDAAKREGLSNVTVLEGAANTTNLPALCCDAILIRDAYHHLTQPDAVVKSLAAARGAGWPAGRH